MKTHVHGPTPVYQSVLVFLRRNDITVNSATPTTNSTTALMIMLVAENPVIGRLGTGSLCCTVAVSPAEALTEALALPDWSGDGVATSSLGEMVTEASSDGEAVAESDGNGQVSGLVNGCGVGLHSVTGSSSNVGSCNHCGK